ncbi:30S ribosomal protein S18 [Caloranaerobacter sp. TR13]|uniref:ribosomal protein S18-alanine N-acetyltransferase n=1 Tax=Caloranaerobacter sp. TR13 TaxID=1302151 RepID=UPI0006D44D2A|nr:ribosomal protein S18-alanine N-acetyltransferase [Caloranaerobacter sp. TR13]KPU26906.1 30S ribosomal protein S18 [Caloranaerobacter sp. TR13]
MSKIIIRDMTEEDIDEVLDIEKKSFKTPWSRDAFVKEVNQNKLAKYIVASIEGKVVGYGGVWIIVDEGHITNIAVHPNFRGLGIGNLLVEGLIGTCRERGINRMTLEVRKSNNIAKSLYKKYGFKEYGIRPGYYSDTKEDAIIMWKEM